MVTDDDGVLVEIAGEGEGRLPLDESHLVVRSMRAAFAEMGADVPGFVLRCTNAIPHGRGLGSSAAAIIGGIVLARAMVVDGRERMTDGDVLQLALRQESHPDNLAAALYGGFTVAWLEDDGFADAVRMDPHPDVHPVVLVPPTELQTTAARALLPAQVPFADATHNVSRSALLVHAMTVDPRRLMAATSDRLHQQCAVDRLPGLGGARRHSARGGGSRGHLRRRTDGAGLRRGAGPGPRRVRGRVRLARAAGRHLEQRCPRAACPAPALTSTDTPVRGRPARWVLCSSRTSNGGMPVPADNCPSCDTVALDAPTRSMARPCPVGIRAPRTYEGLESNPSHLGGHSTKETS